jgi:hypothetical protein
MGLFFLLEEASLSGKANVIIAFFSQVDKANISPERVSEPLDGKIFTPDDFNKALCNK